MPSEIPKQYSLEKRGVVCLHIPKTGGSSVNSLLCSQFGEKEVATHIESKELLGVDDPGNIANKYRYLSGHVPYPQLSNQLELDNWLVISLFRKPDEHVVSHLAWVRLLAEEEHAGRLKQHTKAIREIASYLKALDLSDAREIKGLIQWLEDSNYFLFHNTQTRYLCGGKAGPTIKPNLLHNALKNLDSLDFVGITERFEEFVLMLAISLGFKLAPDQICKENANELRFGLDLTKPGFRREIEPLIEYDKIIYSAAREKFVDNMHQFLAQIEKRKGPWFSSINLKILRRMFLDT